MPYVNVDLLSTHINQALVKLADMIDGLDYDDEIGKMNDRLPGSGDFITNMLESVINAPGAPEGLDLQRAYMECRLVAGGVTFCDEFMRLLEKFAHEYIVEDRPEFLENNGESDT